MFVTPSGNIGCEMIESSDPSQRVFGCGVDNYRHDGSPLGVGDNGTPYWYMDVLHGKPVAKNDAPAYAAGVQPENGYVEPQVVGYGEVVVHGNMVCGVYEVGVTCWDANSHMAVYMERSQTYFFEADPAEIWPDRQ